MRVMAIEAPPPSHLDDELTGPGRRIQRRSSQRCELGEGLGSFDALVIRKHPWNEPGIFFFNDTATTEIYTLSLHDALPISRSCIAPAPPRCIRRRGGSRGAT